MAWRARRWRRAAGDRHRFHEVVILDGSPLPAPAMPGRAGEFEHLLAPCARHYSGDRIVYATAFGIYDTTRGWNESRFSSGLMMEVPSGKTTLENLCMPHSPRVFDGQVYVLESGHGRALRVNPDGRTARSLAELPGFTRGLDRFDILFVGLSRIRDRRGSGPPIAAKRDDLVCGVAAVERNTGQILGYLRFDQSYEEIFDVEVLPGRAFWGEQNEKE